MDESSVTNEQDNKLHAEYIELLMSHMNSIYRYIVTMVPNAADSEDILQETSKLIWVKFKDYRQGTDFKNWALTIARFKVLSYYRSRQQNRINFSSQTLDAISDYLETHEDNTDEELQLLRNCVSRLTARDRTLIQQKYTQKVTTKQLALQLGRPVAGLYSTLARIQKVLVDCVRRNLEQQDSYVNG